MTSCVLVLIIVNSAAVPGLFLSELWLAGSECGHEHSVSTEHCPENLQEKKNYYIKDLFYFNVWLSLMLC